MCELAVDERLSWRLECMIAGCVWTTGRECCALTSPRLTEEGLKVLVTASCHIILGGSTLKQTDGDSWHFLGLCSDLYGCVTPTRRHMVKPQAAGGGTAVVLWYNVSLIMSVQGLSAEFRVGKYCASKCHTSTDNVFL